MRQTSVWKIKCDVKMFKCFEWWKKVSYAPISLNVFKCVSIVGDYVCMWTQNDHKNINTISYWTQDRTEMFYFSSIFPLFSILVFKNLFVPLLVFCLLSSIPSFPPAVGCLSLRPVLSQARCPANQMSGSVISLTPGLPNNHWLLL